MGNITHTNNTKLDKVIPNPVPKNLRNTAPVYPNKADISNLSNTKILDKSIGFNIVAINENLSKGYSLNIINEIKKIPS